LTYRSIKEKYRETLAEADSFKLRLEDAQKAVAEAESRVEQMQERYEEASKSNLDLQLALDELRDEVANRSTESEARQRDEALFDNKEALQKLQETLEIERAEHAREIEMATFVLTKDLGEARGRITDLEEQVGGLRQVSKHLQLAEDKIHRLRADRDDLRLSLNHVNREQRFASQAADAHRQALDLARSELDAKNATLETLDKEYADASARFGQVSTKLESDLAQATEARAALVDRVQNMEEKLKASLAEHQEQASSLVSELALARSKASRAEAELSALRRANMDLEVRHDRAQAILEAKRDAEARAESEAQGESATDRPANGSRHQRRRSGVPNVTTELIEALKIEKADLLGRVSRRDGE
jgi:chromosome segregation ATPase